MTQTIPLQSEREELEARLAEIQEQKSMFNFLASGKKDMCLLDL